MSFSPENFENLRLTIEQASKIVISPNVSKEQRDASEKIFIEFKESKSPYDFCRYLLENTKDSYLLYQTVSTIQTAALREWALLPNDLVPALQNFLFSFLIQTTDLEKYVQRQILQTIAVFYKRNKFDSFQSKTLGSQKITDEQKNNLVTQCIDLFSGSDIKMRKLICSLLLAVINEFSNTNKSTKLGQSNESHFNAKRSFEQNEFKSILVFVYETTKGLIESLIENNITNICSIDKDSKELLIQIFYLIDQSFNWEFTSSKHVLKNLIGNLNQSAQANLVNLEPTPEFKEFFLNPQLVELLFKSYELVRDDPDTSHSSIQPLIQLSTLKGTIFQDDFEHRLRIEFLINYIQAFLNTFQHNPIKDYESFNVSCLIENLLLQSSLKHIALINSGLVENFFGQVTSFLVNCFKAERACEDPTDSKKYLESYEKILISWSNMKDSLGYDEQSSNEIDKKQFELLYSKYAFQIVEAFIQSRLSYQEDHENIQILSTGSDLESIASEDDLCDDDDDLHRFKDILYSIRDFARQSLELSLPLIARLMAEKYVQLAEILKQVYQLNLTTKEIDAQYEKHLNKLSEDIHWLLLINGFVLFEINTIESEENLVPKEIMSYSAKISQTVDSNLLNSLILKLNETTQVHNQPNYPILNSINLNLIDFKMPNNFDPILSFIFTSLQLTEIENHMFSLNMLNYLSPQVATSLSWFLRELSQCLLFMPESNYSFISPTLQHVFGQDTHSGCLILNFLIRKILINFYIWSSETVCTSQTAKILLAISKNKNMSRFLMNNETYWSISRVMTNSNEQPWTLLSSNVKKLIIKSLILSSSGQINTNVLNILQVLTNRFDALRNVKPISLQSESRIKEVMSLLECLNGVIEASNKNNLSYIVPVVLPRLEQGVHLLDLYHNYGEIVELILCMFNGVIEKLLTQLNDDLNEHLIVKNKILECFLGLIQIFAKHNQKRRIIEANIEEDYFNDLLLFLTLLNTLHNINYDNEDENRILNQSTNQNDSLNVNQIKIIDVILTGLEFLIPLMNQEILKFQTLSIEYFKLISNIVFNNSNKIFNRSFDLFNTLINSIKYGINSGLGVEVVRYSLESIQPLCIYMYKSNLQESTYGAPVKDLFSTVLNLIFENSIEIELFDLCSNVLYSFICCFPHLFTGFVNQFIQDKFSMNLQLKEKIQQGFNTLVALPTQFQAISNFEINLSMFNLEKRNRIKFNTKFNEFSIKTYGLLFIR
ncbi:unnamed protein product [Brachionus calyciflorus]|uniref:Exportin-4 n=1 Tax=Brachionus calyciflorus TaxID=104777 RepID=A0A813YPE9_9BILA|nr:unnamed protein product [Brachionus calyciflorus]